MNEINVDSNLVIEALQAQISELSRRAAIAEAYAAQLRHELEQRGENDES